MADRNCGAHVITLKTLQHLVISEQCLSMNKIYADPMHILKSMRTFHAELLKATQLVIYCAETHVIDITRLPGKTW